MVRMGKVSMVSRIVEMVTMSTGKRRRGHVEMKMECKNEREQK